MSVVLYHHPGSLCSQKVRLALDEKGVDYEARTVDIGPRAENFEPWYVRLNPKAVVPTLVHDGQAVTDSARIVRYVDEHFEGRALHASDEEGRAMEAHWLRVADELPLRELSYGRLRGPFGWFLRRTDKLRLGKLARRRDENPDLREAYEAKMEDVRAWFATARDPVQVDAIVARVNETLDALEKHLEGRDFVAGARHGTADVLWTVVLARLMVLGQRDSIFSRPRVRAYFERMKARPSYARARVWDHTPWVEIVKALLGLKERART